MEVCCVLDLFILVAISEVRARQEDGSVQIVQMGNIRSVFRHFLSISIWDARPVPVCGN